MLSLTAKSTHLLLSSSSFADLNTHIFSPSFFAINLRTRRNRREISVSSSLLAAKESGSLLGFLGAKRKDNRGSSRWCGGFARGCKRSWSSEGNIELEAGILEFMRNSAKPEVFPSKKELIDAGRMDLVEGIMRQRGWLALGWDSDNEEEEKKGWVQENGANKDFVTETECHNGACQVENETHISSSSATSSGISLEASAEEDGGIEGILSRLEKERNMNLGLGLREKTNTERVLSNTGKSDSLARISLDSTVGDFQRSSRPVSLSPVRGLINDSGSMFCEKKPLLRTDGLQTSIKPEMWRVWSMQRAGLSDAEFEAAEINSKELHGTTDVSEGQELRGSSGESLSRREELNSSYKEINCNDIRNRLQHLQFELSSVLETLRSNVDEVVSLRGHESSSDNFRKLSDAWEYQENEIMNARDKLRSMRAKLAVLEGKMALAIIDAQRIVEEKQKRIDDAHKALQLLRTACIVWPNSASEVLVAGSFDGWATQRKMEKSRTGIFSVWLKLYPGKYEIKFIVDGEWKIDPLRPIVHNNGYENNLLVIS